MDDQKDDDGEDRLYAELESAVEGEDGRARDQELANQQKRSSSGREAARSAESVTPAEGSEPGGEQPTGDPEQPETDSRP